MKRSMISLLLTLTLCSSNALTQDFSTNNDKVYTAVEQMPQFPGGDVALMKFIYTNIQYPNPYSYGRVVVQFVIKKNGKIGETKIVRGINTDLNEEAIRIIKTLPEFIPGKISGMAVDCWYTIPIRFYPLSDSSHIESQGNNEQRPEFPGGYKKLLEFVDNSIQYPSLAERRNIEGEVIVQLLIKGTGEIGKIKIPNGIDESLSKEALRIVNSFPKFIPGKAFGDTVSMWYTLPVRFKLKNIPKYYQTEIEYSVSEPKYPYGKEMLKKHIYEKLQFVDKKKTSISTVHFVVLRNGKASKIKVNTSIKDQSVDDAIVNAIESLEFIPGCINGKNVNMLYYLPFKIEIGKQVESSN